jgi:hypothetical protein
VTYAFPEKGPGVTFKRRERFVCAQEEASRATCYDIKRRLSRLEEGDRHELSSR